MKLYFICDESGAKGYEDNKEKNEGEIGVFAGYILPEERKEEIKEDMNKIIKKYNSKGKFHITDLENPEEFRKEIFNYIKTNEINFLYTAIYTQGFYNNYLKKKKLKEEAKENTNPNIRVTSKTPKESLHVELFVNLVLKAFAFGLEYSDSPELEIKIDHVDKIILKSMKKRLGEDLKSETIKEVKAWDKDKKEKLEGTITTKVTFNDCLDNVKYSISLTDDENLTIIADVLANSILHYLKEKNKSENNFLDLNTTETFKEYDLSEFCFGCTSKDMPMDDMLDIFFPHPNGKRVFRLKVKRLFSLLKSEKLEDFEMNFKLENLKERIYLIEIIKGFKDIEKQSTLEAELIQNKDLKRIIEKSVLLNPIKGK